MRRAALADAARCVGGCGALRWLMRRTALADAAHCVFLMKVSRILPLHVGQPWQ